MTASVFKPDQSQSTPVRLVNFLLWAAEKSPGRPIALPVIAKSVLMLPRTPNIDGQDVRKIRNAVKRAREIIEHEHRRGIISIPGAGLRATTGSEDLAETQLEDKARRQYLATLSLERTRAMINMREIRDTRIRARVTSITAACRVLTSAQVVEKLALPPKKSDESE